VQQRLAAILVGSRPRISANSPTVEKRGVGAERAFESMTRLPENDFELEALVRERTDAITQYLAAIVEHSDDAIIGKDLNGTITSHFRLHVRRGGRQANHHAHSVRPTR
jgi:hypothetical protein